MKIITGVRIWKVLPIPSMIGIKFNKNFIAIKLSFRLKQRKGIEKMLSPKKWKTKLHSISFSFSSVQTNKKRKTDRKIICTEKFYLTSYRVNSLRGYIETSSY